MQKKFKKSKLGHNKAITKTKLTDNDYLFFLIKNLILKHFRNLSEEIADSLLLEEIENLAFNNIIHDPLKSEDILKVIEKTMDMLAEDLDVILDAHKSSIISECESVINKTDKEI